MPEERWRILFSLGAFSGFFAVAAGAFGAHALKSRLSAEMLAVFETGARYQLIHAVAVLAVASALIQLQIPLLRTAAWLFLAGSVFFSGSLYALALTGIRILGVVTPFGGLMFLAGWLVLAVAPFVQSR